ncbi:M23 family metallopeptidase [Candidatus Parcubacteria bacterium]|nr:M23 family metallopeptidase [Candidatus Parcubacteria bacterium]
MNDKKEKIVKVGVIVALLMAAMASVSVMPIQAANGQIMNKPVYGTFTVSQEFGVYNPTYGWHTGIDIVPKYYYWVFAPLDGKIEATGYDWRAGDYIVISHIPGDSNQYRGYYPSEVWTKYYHLDGIFVEQGERVTRGQVIGHIGDTGTWCTGTHLHFEIRENGRYGTAVNPREYIRFGDGKDIW